MSHTVVTEHLADYLEGDLALDLRALVDAHLDGCDACAQEVREMQQTIRLLRALPEPEVPPMIAANVMRRIRAGEAEPSLLERIERFFGGALEPRFVLPAAAVAVAALVVVSVQGGGPLSRSLGAAREPEAAARSPHSPTAQRVPTVVGGSVSTAEETLAASDEAGEDRTFGASAASGHRFESTPAPAAFAAEEGSDASLAAAPESAASESAMEEVFVAEVESAARARGVAAEERLPVSMHALREDAGASAWSQNPGIAGAARSSRRAGAVDRGLGGPSLAQGFAAAGDAGAALPARGEASRFGGGMPLSLAAGPADGRQRESNDWAASAREDERDRWLNRALASPEEFARYIAAQTLAEQELWVSRLAERAVARGLMGDLVAALRAVAGGEARWLADDFTAQARAFEAAPMGDSSAPTSDSSARPSAGPGGADDGATDEARGR